MNDPLFPAEAYDDLRVVLRGGVARFISEQRRRRRRRRLVALAVTALASISGLALAATAFVGSPAPPEVKRDIAAVDAGMPDALRLDPVVRDARSVASTEESTLWVADLADGGHCLELTTALYPTCARPAARPASSSAAGPFPRRSRIPITPGHRIPW